MAFNKAKALEEAHKYVSQGKVAQAIKQYRLIIEKDPSDLILLNTIGDLYIRDKDVAEGLKCFYRLADAYVRDNYAVKAIAIYKKISKIDRNSADPLLKLGELYRAQGLAREVREQYTSAFEFYKRINQNDKAVEVLRKLAQLEPDSLVPRLNLADFAQICGQKKNAGEAYLEAATLAERQGNSSAAESALNKAADLLPDHPKIQIHRAQQALQQQQPEKAERILKSFPELQSDPGAQRLLLDSYLATHKLDAAQNLLGDVFRTNPADFSPVADFVTRCVAQQSYDAAVDAIKSVTSALVDRRDTGPLMESLRTICAAAPQHIQALELLYDVAEKTADELTIPEVLESLGQAYAQAGQLEKAEQAYAKLVAREPENETYKGMLKQVLQTQGKEYRIPDPFAFSGEGVALDADSNAGSAAAPGLPSMDPEQEAMVREALDNSDLFVRYNLTQNAVAELDKVLAVYPDQEEVHKRILEACRKNLPRRAAAAAEALAGIFAARGDSASAGRYRDTARELAAAGGTESSAVSSSGIEAQPESPAQRESAAAEEIDLTQSEAFSLAPIEEQELPNPQEIPLMFESPEDGILFVDHGAGDSSEIQIAEGPPPDAAQSGTKATVPQLNDQESREEIEFYLAQGFYDEAEKVVRELEENYPGNAQVIALRRQVDGARQKHQSSGKTPTLGASADGGDESVVELPTSFSEHDSLDSGTQHSSHSDLGMRPQGAVGDLAAALDDAPAMEPGPVASTPAGGENISQSPGNPSENLASLLDELTEGDQPQNETEDSQTHYNLGVAFREMELFDEAIGEFQKVVKGAAKDSFPPNFLQACTLLASCFTEKRMPAIAAKWYLRALETPGLDGEAVLAVLYDLAASYEAAGDTKLALEKFTEVYSQNIDYRDVAEKIRLLQHKVS